ncbi:Ras-related protein Rab-23 [Eumeta japonica]|uniref:Ras-related protein Rab-23 n=1 Tax=Eumeta variegata TaxID=151549 RepID=A0A4C1VBH2_EUMVA|nr:Ras-related protein Rab-23 [Eumeta japonica]
MDNAWDVKHLRRSAIPYVAVAVGRGRVGRMREEELELALKVVVVGDGGVGKSSMIQRYCRGTFTRDYKKTIGVDFLERQIENEHAIRWRVDDHRRPYTRVTSEKSPVRCRSFRNTYSLKSRSPYFIRIAADNILLQSLVLLEYMQYQKMSRLNVWWTLLIGYAIRCNICSQSQAGHRSSRSYSEDRQKFETLDVRCGQEARVDADVLQPRVVDREWVEPASDQHKTYIRNAKSAKCKLQANIWIEGEEVRLMLWDTAGQEEFDAITKAYYRGAHACVLAFSTTDRDSFLALHSWKLKFTNIRLRRRLHKYTRIKSFILYTDLTLIHIGDLTVNSDSRLNPALDSNVGPGFCVDADSAFDPDIETFPLRILIPTLNLLLIWPLILTGLRKMNSSPAKADLFSF